MDMDRGNDRVRYCALLVAVIKQETHIRNEKPERDFYLRRHRTRTTKYA